MLKKSIYLSIYDTKKILSNKIFWLTFCISLLFFIIICFNYGKNRGFSDKNYKLLKNYVQTYNTNEMINTDYETGIDYIVNTYNKMVEAKENNTYFQNYFFDNTDISEEYNLFSYIRYDIDAAYSYADFLKNTRETADLISNISIFSKSKNDFSKRNIQKTKSDYASFSEEIISYTGSRGMSELLHMPAYSVIVFVFLFILTILLVVDDKNNHYNMLYNTMKNGKSVLALSKIWTLLCFSLIFTFLLTGITLFISIFRYGFIDMTCAIQSFYGCYQSIFNMKIITFLFLLFLLRWISAFMIGICLLTLTNLISTIQIYTLISILVYVIGLLLQNIKGNTLFSLMKYISPFYLLQSIGFLSEYKNINFFGYPVLFTYISLLLFFIILAVMTILFIIGYSKANIRQPLSLSFSLRKKTDKNIKFKRHSIYTYEMYKILFGRKLLLLFLLIGPLFYIFLTHTTKPENFDRQYYMRYMHSYEGVLSEKNTNLIEMESKRLESAFKKQEQIQYQYETGKLSMSEYFPLISKYQSMTVSSGGFSLVESRLNYLSKKDFTKWLVYEKGWYIFLGVGEFERQNFLILAFSCLCVLISVSGIFPMEEEYQTSFILNTCKYGQKYLEKNKIKAGISCTFISFIITYLPLFIYCCQIYGMNSFFAPAPSLPYLEKVPSFISILFFTIIALTIKFLFLLFFTMFIIYLSKKLKSTLKTYVAGILFLIIPVVCCFFI